MMNGSSPITQSAFSSALSGVHKSHSEMLNAVKGITSGDLDALPESFQQLSMAKNAQAANLKVLEALDETERHLLDIFV